SPGPRRSPHRSLAAPRWPPWQDSGLPGAHALDCQETLEDDPSRGMAIAGGSSVFGLPWHLAIAAGSNCGANQVRGTNRFALQRLRERRPTLAFSGAAYGIATSHLKRASRPPLQRLVRRPAESSNL